MEDYGLGITAHDEFGSFSIHYTHCYWQWIYVAPCLWFGSLIGLSTAIYLTYARQIRRPFQSSSSVLSPLLFDSKFKGYVSLAIIAKTATLVDREHDNGNKSTLKSRFAWKVPPFNSMTRSLWCSRRREAGVFITNGAFFVWTIFSSKGRSLLRAHNLPCWRTDGSWLLGCFCRGPWWCEYILDWRIRWNRQGSLCGPALVYSGYPKGSLE